MTDFPGDNAQAPQNEPAQSAVSPGEMLRRARESLNLTISDLAGQTRLSRAVLEALERNDFASLAMPVYVRGYFRKCAHVLQLPEDKLLSAYAEWTGTPLKPQPVPVTVSEPPEEYVDAERSSSWRYALIVAVVLGAALWWFGSGESPPPSQTGEDLTTLPFDPPQNVTPLPLPATGEGAAEAPASGAPTSPPQTAAVPAAEEGAAQAATPPPGPYTLQLNITRTSWVEIYDDDKRRLVYGLLQPGAEQRVSGKLPYQVVLGYPQGVNLSLGGRAIDLAPHMERDGTARFKIEAP